MLGHIIAHNLYTAQNSESIDGEKYLLIYVFNFGNIFKALQH